MKQFEMLKLPQEVLRVIEERKYSQPTSVQNKSIPYIFSGRDVIVQSATGTGKTLCYASHIANITKQGNGVQALVIAPTKELVKQIGKEIEDFTKYKSLNIVTSFGGGSYKEQKEEIYKADIIIGTTGRISDFVEQGVFELGRIKTVVLDEADELFMSSQFLNELNFILSQCPKISQKLVFSATIPKEATKLIKNIMKDPKRIVTSEYVDPKKLKQVIFEIEKDQKFSLLIHLLNSEYLGLSIIFCNRQDTAEWLFKNLKNHINLEFEVLHGETTQGKRNRILNNFREEKFDLLITTDVAARGLDVENITHVFNYNIPNTANKYIHRIGRTARAGSKGKVINLVSKEESNNFIEILKEHEIAPILKSLPEFKKVEIKNEYKSKKPRR